MRMGRSKSLLPDQESVAPPEDPIAHWKGSEARRFAPFSSLHMMDERGGGRDGGRDEERERCPVEHAGSRAPPGTQSWNRMAVMGGNGSGHRWSQRWTRCFRSAAAFWLAVDKSRWFQHAANGLEYYFYTSHAFIITNYHLPNAKQWYLTLFEKRNY